MFLVHQIRLKHASQGVGEADFFCAFEHVAGDVRFDDDVRAQVGLQLLQHGLAHDAVEDIQIQRRGVFLCMFMFQYSPGNTVNNATSFYSIELITFAHTGKVFCAKDEFEFLKVDLVFAKDFGKDLFEF